MVKKLTELGVFLVIVLGVLYGIRQLEFGAINDERLRLQEAHNVEVLALVKTHTQRDNARLASIDSLSERLRLERRRIARANAKADSLKKILDQQVADLPDLIPACSPWAKALTTCQIVVAQKDSVVRGLTFVVDSATIVSDSLRIVVVDKTADVNTLTENLRLTNEAIDKSRCTLIFGVPCPSRTMSFLGGTGAGILLMGALK